MEGVRLILNDGTIIENGRCGYADGSLWAHLPTGYTMQQAASLFFDAEKTSKIVFQYGDMSEEYDGFTECVNLYINTDGEIWVCLKKGE